MLHQRLESPHRVFALYPPSFWGSEYTQNGWGYEPGVDVWMTIKKYGYTYIDSSYPNILLNHGYLVFFLIMSIMTVVPYQYAKEGKLYLVLLLAIIAIDCAAEGHLKEISCNVWMLFPFSYKNEKHRIEKIRTEMEY